MNKTDIVIFGVSVTSQMVYATLQDDNDPYLNPVAFCVDEAYYKESENFGLPVVTFEEVEKKFPPERYKMLVAIGYHKMNTVRAQKCEEAKTKGYELVTYISSKAYVSSNAKIGENCIILDSVSIGAFAEIGNNCQIFNNSTVSHHTKISDNVFFTGGAIVAGKSTIGRNCWIGTNATIGHEITIGNYNFIGAGAVVTKNTNDNSVYIVPDTPKYKLNTEQFMKMFKVT